MSPKNEGSKLKSLSENNIRLNKLLEDRLKQLENLSRLLNQKN